MSSRTLTMPRALRKRISSRRRPGDTDEHASWVAWWRMEATRRGYCFHCGAALGGCGHDEDGQ